VDVAEGLDVRARGNDRVFDNAMRPNTNAIGQFDFAFEDTTHINEDIASAFQSAAQIEAVWVSQRDTRLEQATRLFLLPTALELCLLHPAVDPQRFPVMRGMGSVYRQAIGHRQANDIGQIIFALS